MPNSDQLGEEYRSEINKRLSMNLLIQGAAAHTFISAFHLARNELETLHPGITEQYDKVSICCQLNYCIGDNALIFGWPNRWWGYSWWPQKGFAKHPFLAKYANRLAREETRHLKKLGKTKGVRTLAVFHWFQFIVLLTRVSIIEQPLRPQLENIAMRIASEIWGIPIERLDGQLTDKVAFGNLQTPKTRVGRFARKGAIAYGGVEWRSGIRRMQVKATSWVFPLLIHELVKGIAELVCLHGLNELSDEEYEAVIDEADQIEYEAWLLQAGPAMWRRLLKVAPREQAIATTLMLIARMEAADVEKLMFQIIEDPEAATDRLSGQRR